MKWWFVTVATIVLLPAATAERLLLDSGRETAFWTPVTGAEFPGATATVDVVTDEELGPCVRARCTFTADSRYAGLRWRGEVAKGDAIGFRVKPLHRRDGMLRVLDSSGQWLAGAFKAEQGVWNTVTVPLVPETFTSHWGGANDGQIHLPVCAVMIAGWRGPDAQELRVSSLVVERRDAVSPDETWRIVVHPGVPLGVAFPNESAPYRIVITNRLEASGKIALRVFRQAPEGPEEELLAAERDIAGWADDNVTVTPATGNPGYWRLRIAASDAARGMSRDVVSGLAVVPQPRHFGEPAPQCYFGMQIIKDLAVAERLGAKAVRQFVFWRYTEGREGHPRWDHTDRFVAGAHALHMDIMLTLVLKAPSWAAWDLEGHPGARDLPDPNRLSDWKRFVRTAVERYRDRVHVIEIENEPDLTCVRHPNLPLEEGADYYARFLAAGAAEVRAAAPDLEVAGLDVSGGDLDRGLPFTHAVLEQAAQWIDINTAHPYASPRNFAPGQHPKWPIVNRIPEKCTAALDAMEAHGRPRRMRIGELGWALRADLDPLSTECLQWSACIVQSMIAAKTVPGVEKYLHFTQHGCNESGHEYGLTRGDPAYPLPAAVAYAAAAAMLNATEPVELRHVGAGLWRAVFACAPRSELVVAWWADADGLAVELPGDAPGGEWRTSFFGTVDPVDGRVPVGRLPVYASWPMRDGAAVPPFVEQARAVAANPVHVHSVFVAGRGRLGLAVVNNTGRDVDLAVRCGGQRVKAGLPGTEGVQMLTVPLLQPFPLGQRRSLPLAVTWDDYDYTTRLAVDLSALPGPPAGMRVDGDLGEWQSPAPIEVRDRQAVLPPDPGIGWDGPADLSLAVRMAADRNALFLAVSVSDDVHAVPHSGTGDYWKSDSLQIALDPQNDSIDAFDEDDREIGLVLTESGARAIVAFPKDPRVVEAPVAIRRTDGRTVYEATLSWQTLEVPPPPADSVMAINLIANDNDGQGRGYWMGVTPGIGEAKNPQAYREFVVRPAAGTGGGE